MSSEVNSSLTSISNNILSKVIISSDMYTTKCLFFDSSFTNKISISVLILFSILTILSVNLCFLFFPILKIPFFDGVAISLLNFFIVSRYSPLSVINLVVISSMILHRNSVFLVNFSYVILSGNLESFIKSFSVWFFPKPRKFAVDLPSSSVLCIPSISQMRRSANFKPNIKVFSILSTTLSNREFNISISFLYLLISSGLLCCSPALLFRMFS